MVNIFDSGAIFQLCYVTYNSILPACLLKRTILSVVAGRILFFFYHIRVLNH